MVAPAFILAESPMASTVRGKIEEQRPTWTRSRRRAVAWKPGRATTGRLASVALLFALVAPVLMVSLVNANDGVDVPFVRAGVVHYTFDRRDDLDLDDQPDDWVRRKGERFPHYVAAMIDKSVGLDDQRSLRFDANGAAAIYYSPLIQIDELHTYYFSGHIRTQGMRHDAAMLSVSLLDHRRERVQRFLSRPVTGDHDAWVPVELGPLLPKKGVRFAVIACLLVPGSSDVRDIGGHVWFDNLRLSRLPRMEVESNFFRHFVRGGSPVEVRCRVSGLDPGHRYMLELRLADVDDEPLMSDRFPLEEESELSDRQLADFLEPQSVNWTVPAQPPGYYEVEATLFRDDIAIVNQETSVVILKLEGQPQRRGEFGWSIPRPLPERELQELPQVAAQAGINALKYPLWEFAETSDPQANSQIAELLDRLLTASIDPVALLSEPPPRIRSQFTRNWHGVNEVLSLSPEFWEGSLEPVIARYSSSVRHWQLGSEQDRSFLGSQALPQTLMHIRQRVQRISLNAKLGLNWDWNSAPTAANLQFLNYVISTPMTPEALADLIRSAKSGGIPRWVVLRLDQMPNDSRQEQASHLARMMLAAKEAGAERIFLDDVYHDEHGLLNRNGSPRRMFIPWRTVALQLQGATRLGSFQLPGGSANSVFVKQGSVFVVIWNDSPTEETLYLGWQPQELSLWGHQQPLASDVETGESKVSVERTPKLIVDGSEPIARWQIASRYEVGKMPSVFGGHDDALLITNTFSQGVSGEVTLNLPPEWEAEPRSWTIALEAGESVRLPTHLRLPHNANLGEQPTSWDFKITADRTYRFRVHRPYTIGLEDLQLEVIDRRLPDGRLEIEQVLTNRTDPPERLDFRCSLFIPDARRQKLQITKLGQGVDRKFYYLPDADRYRGQELWLRLEQDGGRRVLNYRWKVGEDW